jgi:hypothetical protein
LPKGEAKSRTLPAVRLATSDIKAVEAAAKAKNQTVSEWIRSTIQAIIQPTRSDNANSQNNS